MQTISNAVERLLLRQKANGATTGATAVANLGNISNDDASEAVYTVGETFNLPDAESLAQHVFCRTFGTRQIPGLVLTNTAGVAKIVYFTTLRKNVQPVDSEMKAVGDRVFSKDPFFNKIMECRTGSDIFDLLTKVKTLKVTKIETAQVLRYSDGQAVGVRNTMIPWFTAEYRDETPTK
jgi:hypothetical protein